MQTIIRLSGTTILTAIFVMMILSINISAATFTVVNTANTGAGSLRQAVSDSNAAAGSDTIVFDSSFNSPQTITLASVITINPATGDSLTITGSGANLLTFSGNNATQIFALSSGDTAFISGMTLTQAVTGAISNSGTLTITNSTLNANTNNGGFGEGGAISNRFGLSLTVTNCAFTNNTNTAPGVNGSGGAAIYNEASATITNSTFTNNSTVNGAPGGAIATNAGTMTINGSTFTGNTTTSTAQNSVGGAIAVQGGGQLTINNSVLTGNSSTKEGGAIYYQPNGGTNPFLVINNSTISNNIANSDSDTTGSGGGLHLVGLGSVTITGSTISGNTARGSAGDGGGIYVSVPMTMTNSTVSGNAAGSNGGGIFDVESGAGTDIVNINSSTIVNNTATGNGGGYYINSSTPAQNNFRNTIIANNTASGGTSQDIFGTINSLGFNLFRNTTGTTITGTTTGNITGVDPRLDGVLRNNGGATKTHALRRTSPALNAADPANVLATDQRGFTRPGTGTTLPDIGAYELQSNDVVVPAAFDFDDDGRADLSIFRANSDPAFADFQIRKSSDNGYVGYSWGLPGDKLAPADYDGDGKTDVAIWREGESNFYILNSATSTLRLNNFGLPGDILTVGDWDGDGRADLSTYRNAAQSTFYYRGSLNNPSGNISFLPWGTAGDNPQRGDFDGDGKQDAAVFRPSNATWYIRNSSNGSITYDTWGIATDKFVTADYDGDAKTDLAVFRNGVWYIKQSSNTQARYENFGLSTDVAVPADYDGDGKADVAIFRPSNSTWFVQRSTAGILIQQFGIAGDFPLPNAYVR